jgi:serine/threonine-protein kinase
MNRGDTRTEDSNPPGEYYCPTCEKNYAIGDRCPLDNTRLVKLSVPIDPLIGKDLDGRYTIVEKLGQGGMGAVYRAQQHGLGREVAVKVVNAALVSDPEVVKRFLREAKLASRLSHPNAVGVVDFGQTEDGVFYLVMELVQGRTLDLVIKSEKTLTPARVVRIGAQVCDALDGAHALSIVHRDLKPSNIMLLSQGRDLVKVLDFGLAKSVAPDQTSTTMTNAGALLGTPAFMPPELALGEPCDGRADLYSLGCVLYLLAAGRLPFVSDSAHELIALHASDDRPPPLTGIPPGLAHAIEKLLEKNPAKRFQTAAEAREALEISVAATPATGMPVVAATTSPSLGPFPATSDQFKALKTPAPGKATVAGTRPRSETEMERMVSGDTMAAVNDTMVHKPAGASPMPASRRSRWLVPGIVAAMIGVGGGAYFIAQGVRGGDAPAPAAAPAAPQAPAPAPAASPSPAPAASPSPSPAPAPAASPSPPPEPPAAAPAPPPTPPAAPTAKHNPPPARHAPKTPEKTVPPTTTQSVKAPPPPKPGSGSAAPAKTVLPF